MNWATTLAASLTALVTLGRSGNSEVSRKKRSIVRARRRFRIVIWVCAAIGLGMLIGREDDILSGLMVTMLVVAAGFADVGMAPESRRSVTCPSSGQCCDTERCHINRGSDWNLPTLQSTETLACPYKITFGRRQACACPTLSAIYHRYGM